MIALNTAKDKCKEVWTRVHGEEKSITDYVLTETTSANTFKEMKINEGKQNVPLCLFNKITQLFCKQKIIQN